MDATVKVAEIETSMEAFAYWLERDWPRVEELGWLTLQSASKPEIDPRFERRWLVVPHTKEHIFPNFPLLTIAAESIKPPKLSVAWMLSPIAGKFVDMESPIESIANWVYFRFQVEAVDPQAEDPTVARARLGALRPTPPKPREGDYTWDDVFDWWYRGGMMLCPKLQDMELHLGYAKKTIHSRHGDYTREFGREAMPDEKSKFREVTSLPVGK